MRPFQFTTDAQGSCFLQQISGWPLCQGHINLVILSRRFLVILSRSEESLPSQPWKPCPCHSEPQRRISPFQRRQNFIRVFPSQTGIPTI